MKTLFAIWLGVKLIVPAIIALLIIAMIVMYLYYRIKNVFDRIFKKNCYDCKHYYLANVASCGDGCWYVCRKRKREDPRSSMNTWHKYVRCGEFEKKDNIL